MRPTGGGSDGILDKSSKKEKLRKLSSMGEMYQSSPSTISSKRIKLPKKFFDDSGKVNHASVPRKLRSAMKNRHYESVYRSSPIHKLEMPLKDESIAEKITKDEEEVMAALASMTEILPKNDKTDEIKLNNETSKPEVSSPPEKDDSKTTYEAPDSNEGTNNVLKSEVYVQQRIKKDPEYVTDGNKSRKLCSSHVYICQFIKDMQVTKGKMVISHKESKQRSPVDQKTDKNPENIMNGYADKASSEASLAQKTHVPPFFGSPVHDPSQWFRPGFTKQPGSGSYIEMSGLKCVQASMQDVLGPMQFDHRSSGYEENGGLFLVERSPTLKLTLQ